MPIRNILLASAVAASLAAGALAAGTLAAEPGEFVPPGEAAAIEAIRAQVTEGWRRQNPQAGAARRDAHAKAHGCVRARFEVRPGLDRALAQGLFAGPGTYDAWVRFSNGFGMPRADAVGDGRGMAIKLLGVPGRKILEAERDAATQDFLLINHPVFFVRDAADYVDFVRAENDGAPEAFYATRPREAAIAAAIGAHRPGNMLRQAYFSMTPYRLGDGFAKYAARPVSCASGLPLEDAAPADPAARDYLRAALREELAGRPTSTSAASRSASTRRSSPPAPRRKAAPASGSARWRAAIRPRGWMPTSTPPMPMRCGRRRTRPPSCTA